LLFKGREQVRPVEQVKRLLELSRLVKPVEGSLLGRGRMLPESGHVALAPGERKMGTPGELDEPFGT
jgi:hypothetical protein